MRVSHCLVISKRRLRATHDACSLTPTSPSSPATLISFHLPTHPSRVISVASGPSPTPASGLPDAATAALAAQVAELTVQMSEMQARHELELAEAKAAPPAPPQVGMLITLDFILGGIEEHLSAALVSAQKARATVMGRVAAGL